MNTIHKYPLDIVGRQSLKLPAGAQILSVQSQHGQLVLWAHADTLANVERRHFVIVGTGHECPEGLKHLASVQTGTYAWHVFEDVGA